MKIRNILLLCLAALTTLGAVSCGKDDNNNSNNGGETPNSLVGTKWGNTDYAMTLTFTSATNVHIRVASVEEDDDYDMLKDGDVVITEIDATYTYDNGQGDITSVDEDGHTEVVHFTVSGNTMTLSEMGYQIQLTRGVDGGTNPSYDPEDPPVVGELDNTTWSYMNLDQDAGIYESHTVVFVYGTCLYTYVYDDENLGAQTEEQYTGAYTYANGNGSAQLSTEDGSSSLGASFSVSGNQMTFTVNDRTYTLEKFNWD